MRVVAGLAQVAMFFLPVDVFYRGLVFKGLRCTPLARFGIVLAACSTILNDLDSILVALGAFWSRFGVLVAFEIHFRRDVFTLGPSTTP